jgi:hypothetical protein
MPSKPHMVADRQMAKAPLKDGKADVSFMVPVRSLHY